MTEAESIRIRPVVRNDLATLTALCKQHAEFERMMWEEDGERENRWAEQFFGPSPRAHCWLAYDPDNIVGYVSGSLEYSTWRADQYLHMDCLFVREQYRFQGIGSLLFNRVVDFARTERIGRVEWQTPAWNEDAAGFYKSFGASATSKHRFHLETNNQKDHRDE